MFFRFGSFERGPPKQIKRCQRNRQQNDKDSSTKGPTAPRQVAINTFNDLIHSFIHSFNCIHARYWQNLLSYVMDTVTHGWEMESTAGYTFSPVWDLLIPLAENRGPHTCARSAASTPSTCSASSISSASPGRTVSPSATYWTMPRSASCILC